MADLNFVPGDYVRLRLAKKEVEGRVLESHDSSVLLLKLSSGYNIGIAKENILAGRALRKFKPETGQKERFFLPDAKTNKARSQIGMIVTGGTIASKLDAKTGAASHLTDVPEFAKFYPELFDIVDVKKIMVPFMISSESMSSGHWKRIAESCEEMLNDPEISGVIITHGTDFLHYTAAALSFFLRNLNKPVVLTYSQRSIDRASSDANLNLQCAAKMATSDCAEVMLVGHANSDDDFCYAMRGTKVRKLHSSRRDAFRPVNVSALAKVTSKKVEFLSERRPRNKGKVELDASFNDKVALVKFYPGQDPSILDFYALKYKGLVLEVGGLGHVATGEAEHSWIAKLRKHINNGMVVCAVSQTIFGRLDPYVYSNGRALMEAGVIFLEDMLAETAFVKLGWVLGHHGWKGKVRDRMLENFSGELNERLEYDGNEK